MTDKKELIRTECVNGVVTMSYSGTSFKGQTKRYFVSAPGFSLSTGNYDEAVAKFRELSNAITIPM